MTNQIQAELLVLGLILLGSSRFLFVSHTRKDSMAVVPLVGFIISIFNIVIFGVSIREIIIMQFSLWATIWNFRSMLRLLSDVVVDHYELKLVIISVINVIASVSLIFAVFNFLPASVNASKMGVTEKISVLHGNFKNGFSEIKEPFKVTNAKIWNFESSVSNPSGRTIVVFVPPKTANVEIYRIFLQKLAKNGYSVYAGDFYTSDGKWFNRFLDMPFARRFAFLFTYLRDEERFKEIYRANKTVLVKEYECLLKEAAPKEGEMVFLLSENDAAEAMKTVWEQNETLIKGTYDLTFIDNNPSKGLGPIENTDPVLAWHLGLEKDRSGYISSHLAMDVTDFISRQIIGMDGE